METEGWESGNEQLPKYTHSYRNKHTVIIINNNKHTVIMINTPLAKQVAY